MDVEFASKLNAGFKGDCPCCGRYAQIYKRRLYDTAVRMLIMLYKLGADQDYVHYSLAVMNFSHGHIGDFNKAKYWDLIRQKPYESFEKSAAGSWKLTQEGIDFIQGRASIPEFAYIFDDRVLGFSENRVNVREALGKKFNYEELMSM